MEYCRMPYVVESICTALLWIKPHSQNYNKVHTNFVALITLSKRHTMI